MICLYIQTSIFDGKNVPCCKWDNLASEKFRIVTWCAQRLSSSRGRAERDILMIRRGKSPNVSKFEIIVRKIKALQDKDRSDTTFCRASSSWQRRSTTRKSWRIPVSMHWHFSLTTWIYVRLAGRRRSGPSTLRCQFSSTYSTAPRKSSSALLESFFGDGTRDLQTMSGVVIKFFFF